MSDDLVGHYKGRELDLLRKIDALKKQLAEADQSIRSWQQRYIEDIPEAKP